MSKRFWFLLHGWFSLPVWALFCFICVTGTLAVVSHEITWLANPAARAANPEGLPARPLPQLAAAVEAAVPGADVASVMVLEPYLVTAVNFSTAALPHAIAYVNPYTAEVQAVETGVTFIGFMRSLHGWLLFPWHHNYSWGYYLVALMSLVVLGALVTGLCIYKRFWQSFTRPRLRLRQGLRVFLGDFHRLAGVWSLWFLLIVGATGLWYLTQALLWHNDREVWAEPPPVALAEVPLTRGAAPAPIPLGAALAAAQQALPGMRPAWVTLPEHSRDYYSIAGSGAAPLFDRYSYRAFVNPWTGAVAETRRPAAMDALQAVSHLADPLHYGTWGGLWSKALWLVAGLLLSAMSVSGFMIWGRHALKALRVEGAAPACATGAQRLWLRWKYWLNAGLLALPAWYFYHSLTPVLAEEWAMQADGPFTVALRPADDAPPYPHAGARQKDFSVRFCDGCAARIRYAYLSVGATPAAQPQGAAGVLHGDRYTQHAHAPFPRTLGAQDKLWLTLQRWDGQRHRFAWEIPAGWR